MTRLSHQHGQATVFAVLFLTVLLGMTSLVLDVGSWYRADRAAQAAAVAAALAGAQALPFDPGHAAALALEYTEKNGGALPGVGISFSDNAVAGDTISVALERRAPGFFARIFGIDSVTVGARASARASTISAARYAAPIAVDERHPLLSGAGCPCFGEDTMLDLNKVAPGGFRLLNIDGSQGGVGPDTLAEWILYGLDAYMPLGWYYSDPGAKFDSVQVKSAMAQRLDDELLFPVYRHIEGTGANARYDVVGWVGFLVKDFSGNGNTGKVRGAFVRFIAQGLQGERVTEPKLGVRMVSLVD